MDVYIKEGRVYGLLKNRKILKLTLDNRKIEKIHFCLTLEAGYARVTSA